LHCERAGRGIQALQYLARYLYRGVISNRHIIEDDGDNVTFRYRDSQTQAIQTRTLPGDDFMALLHQHVLPKGMRGARDYGFLHVSPPVNDQKTQRSLTVHTVTDGCASSA
jgi:hypothetical protein